jgi:hypothetical protein
LIGNAGFAPIQKAAEPFFLFQQKKFVFSEKSQKFEKLSFPTNLTFGEYQKKKGKSNDEVRSAETHYGSNSLSLPPPNFWELYKEHALVKNDISIFVIFFKISSFSRLLSLCFKFSSSCCGVWTSTGCTRC